MKPAAIAARDFWTHEVPPWHYACDNGRIDCGDTRIQPGAARLNCLEIFERLISFPTISRDSNLELIGFVDEYLKRRDIETRLVHNEAGTKANLFASIGPKEVLGVLLSGHTDVVPVEGQLWSHDPFRLTLRGGRLYGRGTADMKGFLACAMRAADLASRRELRTPLWLSFSYDEEIGCIGVRRLIDVMASESLLPVVCIVGEPTSMQIATGHKGKTALKATCIGTEAHSAYAPRAVNALHLASDFVLLTRDLQKQIAECGKSDTDYELPYTTIHTARIDGGLAPNIVPARATVWFEIRNIMEDDPQELTEQLQEMSQAVISNHRKVAEEADIRVSVQNSYPGLSTPRTSTAVEFVQSLVGGETLGKVAFGTEGGLFSEGIAAPTVICGPGSMEQGHKPDEYILPDQIGQCEQMMLRLVDRLEAGI